MKRLALIISAAILPICAASAQDSLALHKADSTIAALQKQIDKLNEKVSEQQSMLDQLNGPVQSMDAAGKNLADTLDTINDSIKVALYLDGTWKYIKSPEYKNNPDIFGTAWTGRSTNPYGIPLDQLPKKWSIWLVDSLSQYHVPHKTGTPVTSKFGIRWGRSHQGVDISLTTGDPIYAPFDGKVRYAGEMGGYGNIVIIRHTNGLETFYGHLSAFKCKADDWVSAGDVIALGGSTGRSTGPHLHFETRYMGYAFDPEWLIDFKTGELKHRLFILKKIYFNSAATSDQNFDDEAAVEERLKKEAAARVAAQYYTVRSGDSLSKIAAKYHTSVDALCRLNGIKKTSTLQIGKRLRVK